MAENQGTKSSIEMFDLDNGGNQEGLSDQVIVINNFEIEQESDLTLQATSMASDKSRVDESRGSILDGGAPIESDNTDLQRYHVNIDADALNAASDADKTALIPLDLSAYSDRTIVINLPAGTQTSAGTADEDGRLVVSADQAENFVIALAPDTPTNVNIQIEVSPSEETTQSDKTYDIIGDTPPESNSGPVVDGENVFNMNEDGTITITQDDLLANASDPDGDTLSIANLIADDGELVDNGDGTWTFTPDENFNGEINLSYDVSDGQATTAATSTIEVASVNDAAVVSGDTAFDVAEDNSFTITEEDLLANATDVEGDTLSVTDLTADSGTLVDNGDGTWTFTPDENFNGDVNLSYNVSDGQDLTPAEGTIAVEAVNDAAVITGETTFDVNEDGTITISEADLLANATDVDGDTLNIVNLNVDDGTLTDNGDGTWTFTPDENFNGEVNISYDVSDGTENTAATGTIEVAEVNDAVDVSAPTSFSMNEDGTIT
ncbi:MAG: cadherin-like domain-containing protein, partial [Methylocystaceae bacterium]|nr:cadherin-like domain-containing protein [Methylocystaceae bacterium]